MSVLVVSADEEAAHALLGALEHAGVSSRHAPSVTAARTLLPTYVLVVDEDTTDALSFIEDVQARAPWTRAFLLSRRTSSSSVPVILKPFDAVEIASQLARESHLGIVTKQRLSAEARAFELSQLVEQQQEAMIGVTLDGTVRAWNAGATRIYGYTAEEALGRPIREVLGMVDLAARTPREVSRRRKDGTPITCVVSVSPIFDLWGEVCAFTEISVDVTETRKLQREIEHIERLASLGRFATTLAHEINNGLMVIDFAVSYGVDRAKEIHDEELHQAMKDARLAVQTIASFVKQVCAFGRKEPPKIEHGPLGPTLKVALGLVRARASKRSIHLVYEETALFAFHDSVRLAQAVMNVLSNAIDAASSNVRMFAATNASGGVDVIIEDDGPGIDPAIKDRLFDPFFTTKPEGQGTGIGLSVVQQVMTAHGGTIELGPRQGGPGTRAVLSLPAAPPP